MQSAGLVIGAVPGQQPGRRRTARVSAERIVGKDELERVDKLTSLGVKRLRDRFVGTADVVLRREKAKQRIKNGDDIEGLKVEPEVESQVC